MHALIFLQKYFILIVTYQVLGLIYKKSHFHSMSNTNTLSDYSGGSVVSRERPYKSVGYEANHIFRDIFSDPPPLPPAKRNLDEHASPTLVNLANNSQYFPSTNTHFDEKTKYEKQCITQIDLSIYVGMKNG